MCLVAILSIGLLSGTAFAQSIDKAWSVETLYILYTGTIQFTPSYVVPASAGYSLTQGKNVKQAYVNYTRNNVSVTTNGGRLYTLTAPSKTSNTQYSAVATAWESLDPFCPYPTKFNYGWIYF